MIYTKDQPAYIHYLASLREEMTAHPKQVTLRERLWSRASDLRDTGLPLVEAATRAALEVYL